MKICVLCSHVPEQDPRVGLVVDSLSKATSKKVELLFPSPSKTKKKYWKAFYFFIVDGMSKISFFKKRKAFLKVFLRPIRRLVKIGCLPFGFVFLKVLFYFNSLLKKFLCYFCPSRTKDLVWIFLFMKDIKKELAPKIPMGTNLIYANDLETLPAAVAYKKRFPETKIIYDCHEFYPYSHTTPPFWYSGILKLFEKWHIEWVDRMISVSPPLCQKIKETYGKKVYPIVNAEPYFERKKTGLSSFLNKEKVNFIFQGRFSPQRGLEEFLEAWELVSPKNACLYIRGAGRGSDRQKILAQVRSYRSFNLSLFFLEPVSEEDLVNELLHFDVGLIPYKPIDFNYKYCCPNKMNQYMHAGLALISANTVFVSETIEKHKLGKVYDADNVESIVEAIKAFCEDPKFLDASKKAALSTAKNIFNWQEEEKKLLAIVQEMF